MTIWFRFDRDNVTDIRIRHLKGHGHDGHKDLAQRPIQPTFPMTNFKSKLLS